MIDESIKQDTLKTLHSISFFDESCPISIISEQCIDLDVLNILKKSKKALEIKTSLLIIGNFMINKVKNVDKLISYGMLDVLSKQIDHTSSKVRNNAVWCISIIAELRNINHTNAMINSGIIKQILNCLNDKSNLVIIEALNIFVYILDGNLQICKIFINMGILKAIVKVIGEKTKATVLTKGLLTLKILLNIGGSMAKFNQSHVNAYASQFNSLGGSNELEKLQKNKNRAVRSLTLKLMNKFFPLKSF